MKKIFLNMVLLAFIVSSIAAQELKEIRVYKDGDILYSSILTSSDSINLHYS